MKKWLKNFFSTDEIIGKTTVMGVLPTASEAYKNMFNVAWPSAIESVLVSLISSADTIMVGSVGSFAIAAVGLTNQPKFIVLALIFSLNIGVTAVTARRKGENDKVGANKCLKQSLIICLLISILMAAIGFIYARPLLKFAGSGDDIIDIATEYLQIIMVGNVFQSLALTINAAQRGCGNTKISMKSNISANIVNLIFNFFLINGVGPFPRLETKGAAIATVMGNMVAFFMALRSVMVSDRFLTITDKTPWTFDKKTISSIFTVSSSAAVEQVFMRIGFFTNTKIVASLGTTSLATYQICMNILSLSFCFGDGLGVASSSLVGQSLGKKRPDEAYLYGKVGRRLALCIGLILSCMFVVCRKLLISLFTDEIDIILIGSIIMLITAVITPIQTTGVVTSGCLRGAGDVRFVAITSLICITIVRPLATWIFCNSLNMGVVGAWLGLAVDQTLRLIFPTLRFETQKWTKIQL